MSQAAAVVEPPCSLPTGDGERRAREPLASRGKAPSIAFLGEQLLAAGAMVYEQKEQSVEREGI